MKNYSKESKDSQSTSYLSLPVLSREQGFTVYIILVTACFK